MALPGLILVGGLALSLQSSSTRRFAAGAWSAYVAEEVAAGAIAEAAHVLRVEDLFDPALFGRAARPDQFAAHLLQDMVDDDGLVPATRRFWDLPASAREYRAVLRGSAEVRRMLVAVYPPGRPRVVQVPGLARIVAAKNPCIRADRADDLTVTVTPVVYRREYVSDVAVRVQDPLTGTMKDSVCPGRRWVGWGVARFLVCVRTEDLKGTAKHVFEAERRFALRADVKPGEDVLKVSSTNLRFATMQVDR